MSTGFDNTTNSLIPVGGVDDDWVLVESPDNNNGDCKVTEAHPAWCQPSPTNTTWINKTGGLEAVPQELYHYQQEFIVREEAFYEIKMARADNKVAIYIDDSLVYDSNPAFDVYSFLCVPDNKFPIIKVPLLKGVHKIKAEVGNQKDLSTPTGLLIEAFLEEKQFVNPNNTATPKKCLEQELIVIDDLLLPCLIGTKNKLTIYKKTGEEVLVQKDYYDQWNALMMGENIPNGTYYYVLNIENGNEWIEKGIYQGKIVVKRP